MRNDSTAAISLHHRVESAINNSQFVKYRNLMLSEDELRHTAGMAFDYDERGISKEERRRRIALVQLALRIDLATNLVIDGELGQETTLRIWKSLERDITVRRASVIHFLRQRYVMPWFLNHCFSRARSEACQLWYCASPLAACATLPARGRGVSRRSLVTSSPRSKTFVLTRELGHTSFLDRGRVRSGRVFRLKQQVSGQERPYGSRGKYKRCCSR